MTMFGDKGRAPYRSRVPVLCCGNATLGGTGKSTIVADLARRIPNSVIISRGYGGATRHLRRVGADDHYAIVGDETFLYSDIRPTWRGSSRKASAVAAQLTDPSVMIMDDGLQNRSIHKTMSFLIVDRTKRPEVQRRFPFGSLRESYAAAVARCDAVVLVNYQSPAAVFDFDVNLPCLEAVVRPAQNSEAGKRVWAFAGIANPHKFYASLKMAGYQVVGVTSFDDHHPFSSDELETLKAMADRQACDLITTPKDFHRLPAWFAAHVRYLSVNVEWSDEVLLTSLLSRILPHEALGGG